MDLVNKRLLDKNVKRSKQFRTVDDCNNETSNKFNRLHF